MVIRIEGEGVYGRLRFESGGHRVQRVPATEAQGRIHTSACTVAVLPEPTPTQVVLRESDLDEQTCRGSGAGGQHRNKTDSAVQLRHVPSGIVVRCEAERDQSQNRRVAREILRARLWEAARGAAQAARDTQRRSQVGSGMRGDKRRTIAVQRDEVVDHVTGRSWRFKDYARGDW